MKLSELKKGSYKVEESADLKLSDLHPTEFTVEEGTKPLVSAVRQFVQGASSGLSDELAGITEAAGHALGFQGAGGPVKDISLSKEGPTLDWDSLKKAYSEGRDKERASLKKDSEDNPGVSAASNFAGMVISPANKLNPAAAGAAMGVGYSDSDSVSGVAKDAALGTALGYGAGKVADRLSPVVERAAQKISSGSKELANKFAARAIGAERGTIKKLGNERVLSAAEQMLNQGAISAGASTDDLISRNEALKKRGGEMMNQVYSAIDNKGASTFNPMDVAVEVEKKIGDFWRSPLNNAETKQFENTLESILQRGDKPIPLKEAQVLKEEIRKAANFGKAAHLDVTPKEQMARDAYAVINNHIDQAVEKASGVVSDAGLGDVLSKGKEIYGKSKTAEKLLSNKQAREQGNKLIGLTDAIAGAGAVGYGGTTGDWKTAGGVVLAKKGLERFGAQNAALAFNKIAKVLATTPEMANLAKANPQAFNAIVQKLEQRFSSELPKSADNAPESKPTPPAKGPSKWADDGLKKLIDHAGDKGSDLQGIDTSQVNDPKLKNLLIAASDLKPRSKAMEKVLAQVKARLETN